MKNEEYVKAFSEALMSLFKILLNDVEVIVNENAVTVNLPPELHPLMEKLTKDMSSKFSKAKLTIH